MKKCAYLTIDDAPSREFRWKIDYLDQQGIDAIIFCIGNQVYEQPQKDDLIYALEKGYSLGNHSYSHRRFSTIGFDQIKKEISKTEKIIENLHTEAGVPRRVKVFRFPYGDMGGKNSELIQNHLREEGFRKPSFENILYDFYTEHERNNVDLYWTFNVMEYDFVSESDIQKRLNQEDGRLGCEIEDVGGRLDSPSNEVINIHDYAYTTKYFPKIIESLVEKGISFLDVV